MFKPTIYQICLGSLMTGVAILLGLYGTFTFGGQGIYLVGIAIFLMPLVLRLPVLLLSTIVSVLVTDWYHGYLAFTWISMIAYLLAVLIIWLSVSFLRLKIFFLISTLISAILVVGIYYFLGKEFVDQANAIKEAISTSIEMTIVWVGANLLYLPFRLIPKGQSSWESKQKRKNKKVKT